MINIGTHGLQCPDDEDYAAAALFMQDQATKIDELLSVQLAALTGFFDKPTIIVTNSANRTVTASSNIRDPWNTVVFNNSTQLSLDTTSVASSSIIRIGSAFGAPTLIPYNPGFWRFGACTRQTAVGAVTAFSARTIQTLIWDEAAAAQLAAATDRTYDTNTGGNEGQVTNAGVFLTGTNGIYVDYTVSNTNVASNVTLLAGGFAWVTYVGPDDIIEVA